MSSNVPANLKYTREHEWINFNGEFAVVGITDFAQSSLGDVVYVELPDVGTTIKKDQPFGVVESIKSVSDLYAPISGQVLEKNSEPEGQPELLNQDSYKHWLIKIKPSNPAELDQLLNAATYSQQISGK